MKTALATAPADPPRVEVYIRSDASFTLRCAGPLDTVAAQLQAGVAAHGLSLLHVHDLDGLAPADESGVAMRCRVLELVDAALAAELLAADPALAHLLPWRVALLDDGAGVSVVAPRPAALIPEFSPLAPVARLARKLEFRLHRVLLGVRP